MSDSLFFLVCGFGLGLVSGLWLGFKLWRVTYVQRT